MTIKAKQTNERLRDTHEFIQELTDEHILWLLDVPVIADIIDAHLATCDDCGPRLTSLMDHHLDAPFKPLTPEQRNIVAALTDRIVASSLHSCASEPSKLYRVPLGSGKRTRLIGGADDNAFTLRMAAGSSDSSQTASTRAPFRHVETFLFLEDKDHRVFVRGPVPRGTTSLYIAETQYALRDASEGDFELIGAERADVEWLLEEAVAAGASLSFEIPPTATQ